MRVLCLLTLPGCLALPPSPEDTADPSLADPRGALAGEGDSTAPEEDSTAPEDDPGPDWALTEEPTGSPSAGTLLSIAEDTLWTWTNDEDGPVGAALADATSYTRLNAADGAAVLRDQDGLKLALIDLSDGERLDTLDLDAATDDALLACGWLWLVQEGRLRAVDMDGGSDVDVCEAGYGAELRFESDTIYLSSWTGEGRGAPDTLVTVPCATATPSATAWLSELSRDALYEGRWGAARTSGYEGYSPYAISLIEVDPATGRTLWSWSSDDDFSVSAYAGLPGLTHVLSAGVDIWSPRELGPRSLWAVDTGARGARRVSDLVCEALALAPRDDGNLTAWCRAEALWQLTLVDEGSTRAGAPPVWLQDAPEDMVWVR